MVPRSYWNIKETEVGNSCVHPRFYPTDLGWNVEWAEKPSTLLTFRQAMDPSSYWNITTLGEVTRGWPDHSMLWLTCSQHTLLHTHIHSHQRDYSLILYPPRSAGCDPQDITECVFSYQNFVFISSIIFSCYSKPTLNSKDAAFSGNWAWVGLFTRYQANVWSSVHISCVTDTIQLYGKSPTQSTVQTKQAICVPILYELHHTFIPYFAE